MTFDKEFIMKAFSGLKGIAESVDTLSKEVSKIKADLASPQHVIGDESASATKSLDAFMKDPRNNIRFSSYKAGTFSLSESDAFIADMVEVCRKHNIRDITLNYFREL